MKPVEQIPPMTTLDLALRLADRDRALPLCLQANAFFLQEDIGQHGQGPETHDSDGAHQLILIQAQFFFAIAKEDLDIPPCSDVREQHLWRSLQITGSPIASLR